MSLLRLVTKRSNQATKAKMFRDEAIRFALEQHTVRQVAEAAGLSPARVHQIGKTATP